MTGPTWIKKASLQNADGERVPVRAGCLVDLLPFELTEDGGKKNPQRSYDEMRKHHLDWLGPGPYVVSKIGQWPCTHFVLYLDEGRLIGAGVHEKHLMFVGESSG